MIFLTFSGQLFPIADFSRFSRPKPTSRTTHNLPPKLPQKLPQKTYRKFSPNSVKLISSRPHDNAPFSSHEKPLLLGVENNSVTPRNYFWHSTANSKLVSLNCQCHSVAKRSTATTPLHYFHTAPLIQHCCVTTPLPRYYYTATLLPHRSIITTLLRYYHAAALLLHCSVTTPLPRYYYTVPFQPKYSFLPHYSVASSLLHCSDSADNYHRPFWYHFATGALVPTLRTGTSALTYFFDRLCLT